MTTGRNQQTLPRFFATTIPPTDNRESAILQNLPPGAYTAIVRGLGNYAGVAVVEAYQLRQCVSAVSEDGNRDSHKMLLRNHAMSELSTGLPWNVEPVNSFPRGA
jgi:hypothetical protein